MPQRKGRKVAQTQVDLSTSEPQPDPRIPGRCELKIHARLIGTEVGVEIKSSDSLPVVPIILIFSSLVVAVITIFLVIVFPDSRTILIFLGALLTSTFLASAMISFFNGRPR